MVVIALAWSVFPYSYRYPASERTLETYARDTEARYTALANSDPTLDRSRFDEAALADIKEWTTRQSIDAAEHNRSVNQKRQYGRATALMSLIGVIGMALLLNGTIFLRDTMHIGATCHAIDGPGSPSPAR